MDDLKISKKKPSYPVNERLNNYLKEYNRNIRISILYDDLLRFQGSVTVYDKNDKDTLWIRVYYSDFDREEIIPFLNVDAVDYCTFGNSKPFRVKIRNVLNDNYTYFYVKKADASRIYGLELEHMLSPYNLNFMVHKDTLIEEHIAGIPGDEFINSMLPKCTEPEKSQIAKEFVKFNERCMIRLLGDMRSYNYVIVPTHDFDHVVYKIRAIDFDQQSYEGKFNVYRPQFFKENLNMVELVAKKFQKESIDQYKIEERSIIAKRMISYNDRIEELLDCMINDSISNEAHIKLLKGKIYDYTLDLEFKRSNNMGSILKNALAYVKRNYENVNTNQIFFLEHFLVLDLVQTLS